MSNWTDENRLRLIKAYKKRPVLWCRSDPDHSVLEKRKEALADLTKYMNKFEKLEIFNGWYFCVDFMNFLVFRGRHQNAVEEFERHVSSKSQENATDETHCPQS